MCFGGDQKISVPPSYLGDPLVTTLPSARTQQEPMISYASRALSRSKKTTPRLIATGMSVHGGQQRAGHTFAPLNLSRDEQNQHKGLRLEGIVFDMDGTLCKSPTRNLLAQSCTLTTNLRRRTAKLYVPRNAQSSGHTHRPRHTGLHSQPPR